MEIKSSKEPYDYKEGPHWYVNFADTQLFGFYGGMRIKIVELQELELITQEKNIENNNIN